MTKPYDKTAAQLLDYYKKKVFAPMGINIDGAEQLDETKWKLFRNSTADQLIGRDKDGDYARKLASRFFYDGLTPVADNPLFDEPHDSLAGWLVDVMKLIAFLFAEEPFELQIDLTWIYDDFPFLDGDLTKQLSPSNKEALFRRLPSYLRVGALLAKMVYGVASVDYSCFDAALADYYAFWDRPDMIDLSDKPSCYGYIDRLRDTVDVSEWHIEKGRKLGLSMEEIGLVDSLWTEIPHSYPNNYVSAAKEICLMALEARDRLGSERKTRVGMKQFIVSMVKDSLPIAEKHGIDMQLDDEHSLPMGYLRYWLRSIYKGDDIVYRE